MDKETQFAIEVIEEAKRRGINICLFIGREDSTFHYRVHSNTANRLITAAMNHLNEMFKSISQKRGT